MKLELSLLRTRVARRMLLLFLLCAVVPVVVLGGVSYFTVAARLDQARHAQARGDSKVAGLLILGELEKLAAKLQTRLAASGSRGVDTATQGSSFASVAVERAPGTLAMIKGELPPVPQLNPAQIRRLAGGRPVMMTTSGPGPRGMFIVVSAIDHDSVGFPRMWGFQIVQQIVAATDAAPHNATLCLRDAAGPLTCEGLPAGATSLGDASGEGRWTHDGVQMTSSAWHIFLKYEFLAPDWAAVLSAPSALEYMPLSNFAREFLLILVFAVVLVFIVSHVQIRQRMTPLADLEAGTRRLRDGDFSSRVAIDSDDEFESLGASFNQMATDLQRQFTTLSALHDIDHAALQDHSAGAITAAALRGAPALLRAELVAVATATPGEASAWRFDAVTSDEECARLADVEMSSVELAELAGAGHHVVIAEGHPWPSYCEPITDRGCRELILFPIRGRREPVGVLIVGVRGSATELADVLGTGRQLAEQLALGLSNVSLLEELDSLSMGALTALARTIDAASHWTAGHSERVTQYAVEIARALGFDAADQARLRQGGLLHDIGKIGVPPAILDKAGPLNEAELGVMQSHPAIGARIVESVRAFRDLVPLVLHHHELLDGSGYPAGLRGDEIPPLVRVLTVADVFDALTSDRPYRKGLTAEAALGILTSGVGTKFDANAVLALHELVIADCMPKMYAEQQDPVALAKDEQLFMGIVHTEQAA